MPAPPPAKKQGSFVSILLAAVVGLLMFGGMLAVCAVMFGPVVFVFAVVFGGGIFTFAVFHYLVWGWWLGKWMRRESELSEADHDR